MKYKDVEKIVLDIMPNECQVTSVVPEGLATAIYVKNIRAFYDNDQLIKQLAGSLKKKVIVRVDASALMEVEKAKKEIKNLVSEEAGITDILFNPSFSEVNIEALKPGLVIGKHGSLLKEIMLTTGWSPKVLRAPTIPSATLNGVRKSIIQGGPERKKFLMKVGKSIFQDMPKTEWVRAVALGGFKEVGRSCLFVQTENSKILIDCGVNPVSCEPKRAYPYLNMMGISLSSLDAVIITHAHIDHMGFLPYLFAYGYTGPVYCTPPTRDLMIMLQQDYLNLANRIFDTPPPYSKKDIQTELKHVIAVDYGEVVDITPEVKMTLYNAGHILGSSQVHLHIGEGAHNLVYTGDMKFGFTKLLNPANTVFPRVETLFIESTYGGRNDIIKNRSDLDIRLIEVIKRAVERKGKVLIPVFAVGRSQEVLLVLEQFYRRNPDFNVPVYIDGMVLEASAIHTAYPEYLRESLQRRILSNNSPFESPMVRVAKGEDKKAIVDGEPCIILAPSGMLNGGPSYEYLKLMAGDDKNSIIFVGYQSPLSLGSKIQRGMKEVPILDDDGRTSTLAINMEINTVEGFSGHSDRSQLLAFLKNLKPTPSRIITMHGDESKTDDLAHSAGIMLRKPASALSDMEAVRLK
ncbi:beta-CASP ribonuclease aCPSF1 [Candidatus Micrarchaeota archaeon]|nr:beta-CASP ribonuclease aCPSF1 [Candidatus Micrarchaeota archaeon]